ncbi:C40 family peptidase [Candidatus Saccharibacteria bacterium]|nr:C40 family peptidase [Candidatus Saccharibacteria bacterium]
MKKIGAGKIAAVVAICLVVGVGVASLDYLPKLFEESETTGDSLLAENESTEEAIFNESIGEYDGDEMTEEEFEALAKQDEDEDIVFEDEVAQEDQLGPGSLSAAAARTKITFVVKGVRKDNINVGDSFTVKVTTDRKNIKGGGWTNNNPSCVAMNSATYNIAKQTGTAKFTVKKACTFSIKFTVKEPSNVRYASTTKTLYLKSYPVISVAKTNKFQSLIKSYAWASFSDVKTSRKSTYESALSGNYRGGCNGNDCSAFTGLVIRKSGIDTNFPGTTTDKVYNYLVSSGNWMDVTGRVQSNNDARPGDVIITRGKGHVLMYVGKISGFGSVMASASYSPDCSRSRAPMADKQSYITWYKNTTNNGKRYAIFRHK